MPGSLRPAPGTRLRPPEQTLSCRRIRLSFDSLQLSHKSADHTPHRCCDSVSDRKDNSPPFPCRIHSLTAYLLSGSVPHWPAAVVPNTASAHKGIGTDPNVNHRVPKFLFSTIYPIVSHSYLYYLTCAFIINDSITETTFPISLLILHLVIAVFAHSRTRPKKASGILIISKQSNIVTFKITFLQIYKSV